MDVLFTVIDTLLPFEWLAPSFMKYAFIALLLAAPLFGLLGSMVVSNHMAFFSDAIGHSALTGIALGVLAGIQEPLPAMILFSIVFGFAISAVKMRGKSSADTVIGVFSSASVALGLVLLSSGGNFSRYSAYLVGDILSISGGEIALLACAAVCVVAVWLLFYNRMLLTNLHRTFAKSRGVPVFWIEQLFAAVTAVIVTLAIRWTGLLVINSLLVLPAAASRLISRSSRQYTGWAVVISLCSSVAGLSLSYYAGAASGAVIVLVNTAAFVLCLGVSLLRRN